MSTDTDETTPRQYGWEEQLTMAEGLRDALRAEGIRCGIYAERNGVPACQIYTTAEETEFAPSLCIGTEGEISVGGRLGLVAVEWFGQFNGYEPEFYDVGIRILQRTWLGDDVHATARELVPFCKIIRKGGDAAEVQS